VEGVSDQVALEALAARSGVATPLRAADSAPDASTSNPANGYRLSWSTAAKNTKSASSIANAAHASGVPMLQAETAARESATPQIRLPRAMATMILRGDAELLTLQ
jgi:hypothetical protein